MVEASGIARTNGESTICRRAEVRTTHTAPMLLTRGDDVSKVTWPMVLLSTLSLRHTKWVCPMGANRGQSIVNPELRHWDVPNLYVVDGSVLPTSLGVNPSMAIYVGAPRVTSWLVQLASRKAKSPTVCKPAKICVTVRGHGADR